MSGLWLTVGFRMRFAMKIGTTFLSMQAFKKQGFHDREKSGKVCSIKYSSVGKSV